jgi:hypothetical protein
MRAKMTTDHQNKGSRNLTLKIQISTGGRLNLSRMTCLWTDLELRVIDLRFTKCQEKIAKRLIHRATKNLKHMTPKTLDRARNMTFRSEPTSRSISLDLNSNQVTHMMCQIVPGIKSTQVATNFLKLMITLLKGANMINRSQVLVKEIS